MAQACNSSIWKAEGESTICVSEGSLMFHYFILRSKLKAAFAPGQPGPASAALKNFLKPGLSPSSMWRHLNMIDSKNK